MIRPIRRARPTCWPLVRSARHALALVVPALALVVPALLSMACAPQDSSQKADYRATVSVEEARRETIERVLATTGTVRAAEEAKIVAESGGKLKLGRTADGKRRLMVGDAVQEGQLIAIVAADDVRAAARLDARKQALDSAQADLDRTDKLFQQGVVAQQVLDQKRSALSAAQADWQQGLVQEGKSALRAPLSGFVTKVTTSADGEFVTAGSVLAEVMDFRSVWVDVDLSSGEVLDVTPGLVVRVRDFAGQEVVSGKVDRIAPAIDPATRTFRVEALVANADGRLRPGMFVRAEIVLAKRDDALTIPTRAVVQRQGSLVVFVADAQTAHQRPVKLGIGREDRTEVTEGLAPGDRVVVSGQDTLRDATGIIVGQ